MRLTNLLTRPVVYLLLVAGLGLSVLPLGRATPPPETTHFFTETGFAVTGRFLQVWRGAYTYQQSVAIIGYPISDVHDEVNRADGKTYRVQWFERARFEMHPEKAPPDDVQLGLLGVASVQGRNGGPPFQPVARPAGLGPALAWFPETQHTIRGPFLQFWNNYGGVAAFGFPIAEPFMEQSRFDGHTYEVQYFERSRLELHPGAAPEYGDVMVGQLGREQYAKAPNPPSPLPTGPTATPP